MAKTATFQDPMFQDEAAARDASEPPVAKADK